MSIEQQTLGINLQNINTDIDRVLKRQKQSKKNIDKNIDSIINEVESLINKIDIEDVQEVQNNASQTEKSDGMDLENQDSKMLEENLELMSNSVIKSKPIIKTQDSHKEFFAYLSKLGKDLEKSFLKNGHSSQTNNGIFNYDLDHNALCEAISEYLISEGYFEQDKTLREECGLNKREKSDSIMKLRKEVNELIEKLESGDITAVIEWAENHIKELSNIESNLLFQAYKLHFQRLVKDKKIEEAIIQAREKMAKYIYNNTDEISRLMTSILYVDNIESSPYKDLYSEEEITRSIKKILEKDSKKIVGLPAENPLLSVFKAGVQALPQFQKYKDLITTEKEDSQEKVINEIPYAPELEKSFNFHSIIVCPVSKEVCSPENSAMLQKCGHIVSEQSIKRMVVSRNKKKFKCPTCPNEQCISQVRKINY